RTITEIIAGARNDLVRAQRLQGAVKHAKDKNVRSALLGEAVAYGISSRTGDGCRIAEEALDLLAQEVPGKADEWLPRRIELYRTWAGLRLEPEQREAVKDKLLSALTRLGEAAEDKREWKDATDAWSQALRVQRSDEEFLHRLNRARYFAEARSVADDCIKKLEPGPKNGGIREALLRILTVRLDSASQAARHLTADAPEQWRTYLPLAARPIGELSARQCAELGEWYYRGLATPAAVYAKANALFRGRAYYQRYLSLRPKGLDASVANARRSLAEIQEQLDDLEAKGIWPIGAAYWLLPKGAVLVMTFDARTGFNKAGVRCVRDLSGRNNHGVVRGPAAVGGKAGEALEFDGIDDSVAVKLSASLTFSRAVTAVAWVKAADTSGCIASQHVSDYKGNFVFGYFERKLRFGRSARPTNSTAITDGKWHHVVGVYDLARRRVEHYIDGELVGTFKEDQLLPRMKLDLTIGQVSSGKWQMRGLIDELALFGRPLTQREIRRIHQAGMAGKGLAR
ncbi:MAG: LamG domain-containing protein, partial [Phycisphaerae bacterium]